MSKRKSLKIIFGVLAILAPVLMAGFNYHIESTPEYESFRGYDLLNDIIFTRLGAEGFYRQPQDEVRHCSTDPACRKLNNLIKKYSDQNCIDRERDLFAIKLFKVENAPNVTLHKDNPVYLRLDSEPIALIYPEDPTAFCYAGTLGDLKDWYYYSRTSHKITVSSGFIIAAFIFGLISIIIKPSKSKKRKILQGCYRNTDKMIII
ncbi:MAG: hypothetical protein KAT43_01245 [Nanoarchaeota archaeon]|nr:hypothetical protein [Nanoarchaeota archaeon]